jgi:hypothetical protein
MREVRVSARGIAVLSTAFWSDDKSDRVKSLERTRQQILEFKKIIGQTSPDRPRSLRKIVRILHDRLPSGWPPGAAGGRKALGRTAARAPRGGAHPYNPLFGHYAPEEPGSSRGSGASWRGSPAVAGVRRDVIRRLRRLPEVPEEREAG